MSNKEDTGRRNKLSQEMLGLFGASAAVSIFFYGFLSVMADSVVQSYCERTGLILTEIQIWSIDSWIRSISFVGAGLLFIVLFLLLTGQKLAYLQEIIKGIEALHLHRMDYEIALEGNNELTELAESINYLARAERELQQKEAGMREEREALIRALSHDIRTPLTSMLSYSEYINGKDHISREELDIYMEIVQQKAEQIKALTDRLLDDGNRSMEQIEDGRFLMEQLADEWEAVLEDSFSCDVNLDDCPAFSGEFDIQELRRIFDNLASNVEKYADREAVIGLYICEKDGHLAIRQTNTCRKNVKPVESYKIGIENIRRIAGHYGGDVEVLQTEQKFEILIVLQKIN